MIVAPARAILTGQVLVLPLKVGKNSIWFNSGVL